MRKDNVHRSSTFCIRGVLLPLMLSAGFAVADPNPLISSAAIDIAGNTLLIFGTNLLGSDGKGPSFVALGSPAAVKLTVTSSSATQIIAVFPALPSPFAASGLAPNAYVVNAVYADFQAQYAVTLAGGGPPQTTTLLFPFVTSQTGFNTGIAISNVSEDGILPPASGACTLSWFGLLAPSTPTSSPSIAGGTSFLNLVSIMAPGFQGYTIAHCNFNAQGFAFISDFGAQNLAMGYLPIVSHP